MVLPTSTEITAAYTFITSVWSTFAVFGTMFAIVAGLKLGSFALRVMKRAIPG
jgi:hypothetical protein